MAWKHFSCSDKNLQPRLPSPNSDSEAVELTIGYNGSPARSNPEKATPKLCPLRKNDKVPKYRSKTHVITVVFSKNG